MDPLTKDINALVEDHLPNFKFIEYNLMFGGIEDAFSAQWMLDGFTPVTVAAVIDALNRRGVNLAEIMPRVTALATEKEVASIKRTELRASAKAKLTPEEIEACGL